MNRARAVGGAALVLVLLVLPPAISAGQDPAPGEATEPAPAPTPPPAPAPSAPEGGSASQGEGAGVPKQEAASPAEEPSAGTAEVRVSSAGVAPATRKSQLARAAADVSVSIGDNFFTPKTVSISVGDTVTWTNDGQAQHSATADNESWDTGVFGPGASRSHTFNQAGSFRYQCSVHGASQSGTVKVTAASGGGGRGGGGGGGAAASGPSEKAAVASAGAAGSSSSLPSTGSDVLPPMVAGLLLLAGGFALRLRDFVRPA
jgi:LPXTG-motif cell wall-anchored protein